MATDAENMQIPADSGGQTSAQSVPGHVDPAALTAAQLARLLGVQEDTIRRHVAAGAPASVDGRMNLVHYAAWLNKCLEKDGLVTAEPEAKPDGD